MCWLLQDQVLWESCRKVCLQGVKVERLLQEGHCVRAPQLESSNCTLLCQLVTQSQD